MSARLRHTSPCTHLSPCTGELTVCHPRGIPRRANDAALSHFAAGRHSEAFELFTEAIRLCPTSPVYHCNRAATALKLNRPDIAAQDAENAVARDGTYVRAYLRAGRARLRLQEPEPAERHFQQALQLDAHIAAAQSGLAEAAQLKARQRDSRAGDEAQAQAALRPAISRQTVPEQLAAMQFHTAEQMLQVNPSLEAAKMAYVEALIACTRYGDALAACDALIHSTERVYLEAESLWRQGGTEAALSKVEHALQLSSSSQKCLELRAFLEGLARCMQRCASAMEDGVYLEAAEACSDALTQLDPGACTGMYCVALHHRAQAAAHRVMWQESLEDLNAALHLEPANADCLVLRAEVHKQQGKFVDHFLDLQRLKKVAPGTPGLVSMLEAAAHLCMGAGAAGESGARAGASPAAAAAAQALGLPPLASADDIRRAYLRLAAECHPDKWTTASPEEQAAAEERFKSMKTAYDVLTK